MRLSGAIFFAALALTAQGADLPALNNPASTDSFPGKFVWADLFTTDQAAATSFYTGLFGWTAVNIDRSTPEKGARAYVVLYNGDRPVAGIATRPAQLKDEVRGHWIGYVSVADVPATLAAATAAGGRVLFPAKNLPQRGTQAIFLDGEGAMLGVMRSSSGDPGEYRPDPGDWTWAEYFARDPTAASQFYHTVLGYEATADTRGDRKDAFILTSGGYARASLAPLPDRPHAHPSWLLFVRVNSVAETVSKVTALGGRVLVAPKEIHGNSWLAIIADPVGAAIGVVELEEPAPAAAAKEQP